MRIAFLGSSGIGDFLVSTPVLRKLREIYPDANICYVVSSPTPFRELFEKSPYVDELFEVDKRNKFVLVKSILMLRRREYDIAVCPFPRKLASKIFVRLIRTKQLIESPDDYRTPKNIVQKSIESLEAQGIKFRPAEKKLFWPYPLEPYKEKALEFLKANGVKEKDLVIVIHTGSRQLPVQDTWSPNYWPAREWVKVIDYLTIKYRAKVVVIGFGKDAELVSAITAQLKHKEQIINAVDKFIVRGTAALIDRCSLFISTNSGPMWIAACLQKSQIAICGPSLSQWEPYNKKAAVVRNLIKRPRCCPPCSEKKCYYRDNLCMVSIHASAVIETIETMRQKKLW
jgi:ADP-heptose:LPS heptosyltransferase